MMKVKRGFWAVALASAIVIHPDGKLSTLLDKSNPWRGYQTSNAILAAIRASRVHVENCAPWTHALINDSRSVRLGMPQSASKKDHWSTWFPLEKDEIEAIEECHEQPCDIKLNDAEVAQMASTPKDKRIEKFLSEVQKRGEAYEKNGVRSGYEYKGAISDPWAEFKKLGLTSGLPLPGKPSLGLRKLDFHNDRARPIRQLVDRRAAITAKAPSKTGKAKSEEATIWIRDVYSNHYFDSWGEWGDIQCDPDRHEVTATLAVVLEFDVLKNTGILSSISRGSAKSSMRGLMNDYLDQWWSGLKKTAESNTVSSHH
jgi:hypothetical protein